MVRMFYILTDCSNLSARPGYPMGLKFQTREDFDTDLLKSKYNPCDSTLPLYKIGMEMEKDKLYKTNRSLNHDCCFCYVIQTEKVDSSNIMPGYDIIEVDKEMVDKIYDYE